MKHFLFIRHGRTAGNLEKRYIGRTDEPLCAEGREDAEKLREALTLQAAPVKFRLFVSPMKRCLETADIAFPDCDRVISGNSVILEDLRECDFGIFEGKTADELTENPLYSEWVADRCLSPIPGGEDVAAFKERVCRAFREISGNMEEEETSVLVTHGGVIMAILEKYGTPKKEFYEYHLKNGGWIFCDEDGGGLTVTEGTLHC